MFPIRTGDFRIIGQIGEARVFVIFGDLRLVGHFEDARSSTFVRNGERLARLIDRARRAAEWNGAPRFRSG